LSSNNPIPKLSVNVLGKKKNLILRMDGPDQMFEVAIDFDKVIMKGQGEVLHLMLNKIQQEIQRRVQNN